MIQSTIDKDGEEISIDDVVCTQECVEATIVHIYKNGKVRLRIDEWTPDQTIPGHDVALLVRMS